jgi:hypothetical protein
LKRRRKMPNQQNPKIEHCTSCNLILENGAIHVNQGTCIQAMQAAMIEQKKSAEGLSYALSTKWLEVMETLCVEHGAEFKKARDVFVAMGEWSPLKLLQEELQEEQKLNVEFQEVLAEVEELLCRGAEIPFLLRRRVRGLLGPEAIHLEVDGPPEG